MELSKEGPFTIGGTYRIKARRSAAPYKGIVTAANNYWVILKDTLGREIALPVSTIEEVTAG